MRETVRDMMADVSDAVKAKRVANNTIRYERPDGSTVWRLHHTDVVTRHSDGTFTLNSGGWKTVTTKDRINAYAPVNVHSEHGLWYVKDAPFHDGMRIAADGTPLDKPADAKQTESEARKLKREIAKFCKLVDIVDELPVPNTGDCWFCMMQTETGETLGDATGDTEHLRSHIDEGYLHGSLLVNAMRWAGYKDIGIALYYDMANGERHDRSTFKRALRRYLGRKLGLAV